MSVLKKCCICDGPVVDGRCSWCGMPYRNDENRYHLNENLRDHINHMSEKERQAFFRKQQSLYTQPTQPTRQAPRPQNRNPQQSKTNTSGIIVFVLILACIIIPLLMNYVFS